MVRMPPRDDSDIGFTALFTGEIWRRNGLAAPSLGTRTGRLFYRAARPFERLALHLLGTNQEIILLQRHRLIDHLTRHTIREQGVTQVVELACGLSPRGTRFCREFGDGLLYVEADLPDMAARKRRLLGRAGELGERHRVVNCNILARDSEDALESVLQRELDPSRNTLVITEGLINYFDTATMQVFWSRLAAALGAFPAGYYLSDLYSGFSVGRSRSSRLMKELLAAATRRRVTLHFQSEAEVEEAFRAAGFAGLQLHEPEAYSSVLDDMPRSRQRRPSVVRVLSAIAGH